MAWFIVQSLITLVLAFLLGILVGWLLWARRRPAAAEEQPAACTCDAGAEEAAPEADDADLDADASSVDAEADADLDDVDATSQDVDAAELVAAYEALEALDADLDSPTASADGAVETDTDADVAALAVAVGALNKPAGAKDDIERIEGIGPKIGKALRKAGLGTYAAIADASQESLREAIKAGGVKFAPSVESWSDQARLLADGDEAGFQALTDRLVAGRVKD